MAWVDLPALISRLHRGNGEPCPSGIPSGLSWMEALSTSSPMMLPLSRGIVALVAIPVPHKTPSTESCTKMELRNCLWMNEWSENLFLLGKVTKKSEGRGRKHRKMSVSWEEHWTGYLGTQDLFWVLPQSTYVALAHCLAFLSIDFIHSMVRMLIRILPTSEAPGALEKIEWNISYERTRNIIKML